MELGVFVGIGGGRGVGVGVWKLSKCVKILKNKLKKWLNADWKNTWGRRLSGWFEVETTSSEKTNYLE